MQPPVTDPERVTVTEMQMVVLDQLASNRRDLSSAYLDTALAAMLPGVWSTPAGARYAFGEWAATRSLAARDRLLAGDR